MGRKCEKGSIIAQILAAEWTAPPSIFPTQLAQVTPILLNSGGGAWAWRQIRQTDLNTTPAAHELHQAYRMHALQVAIKELELARVFASLRAQGLDPLLGKGWAIARQYPEPGLRPFGDIDLYVRRDHHNDFRTALQAVPDAVVDLHTGAAELDDRSFDELYAHSHLLSLQGVNVRVFGPEDQLRLLCLHFLREGALRPLWLCDIAVAIAGLPQNFDWNYCLSGNAQRTAGVICTIGLAHKLLGVPITTLPIAAKAATLPRWLLPAVLKLWGQGKPTKGRRRMMAAYLRHPTGVLSALQERWPNAIEATVGTKAPFNNCPRWPFQLGECVLRTTAFAQQVPRLIQKSKSDEGMVKN
jgi:hypothetical protein